MGTENAKFYHSACPLGKRWEAKRETIPNLSLSIPLFHIATERLRSGCDAMARARERCYTR